MKLTIRATDLKVIPSDSSGYLVDIECADAEQVREQILRRPDDGAQDWPLAKRYGEIVDECEKYRLELRRLQGAVEVGHLDGTHVDPVDECALCVLEGQRDQLQADLSHAVELRKIAEERVRVLRPVLSANDRCELLETVASLGSTIRGLEGDKAELLEAIRRIVKPEHSGMKDSECPSCLTRLSSCQTEHCSFCELKALVTRHERPKP
jgi:hypothetical protein